MITIEPKTPFYDDRAVNPEGHIWSFGQTVKQRTPAEWDAAMPGIKTRL